MYEMPVSGEIKTLAFKEGSSGIFTGSLQGLYHGYRFGSTTPDVQQHVLEANNGTIALVLKQEIRTILSPRPSEHPFAGGKDPFENMPATPPGMPAGGPPPGVAGGPPGGMSAGRPPQGMPGGPPPGMAAAGPPPGVAGTGGPPQGMPGGGPPPGMAAGGPPPGVAGGPPRGLVGGRPFYMEVMATVDPEQSTGIFAGATGQMELSVPNYRMAGYLVIETKDGDLRLDFLEGGSHGVLDANLWVNGEESTGIWHNARGDLTFSLKTVPPNFGRGPYSGTIQLEQEPPK